MQRVREFIKHLLHLLTFGWDFPVIRWWRARPRVAARIERRRKALKVVVRPVVRVAKLLAKIVILPIRFILWR